MCNLCTQRKQFLFISHLSFASSSQGTISILGKSGTILFCLVPSTSTYGSSVVSNLLHSSTMSISPLEGSSSIDLAFQNKFQEGIPNTSHYMLKVGGFSLILSHSLFTRRRPSWLLRHQSKVSLVFVDTPTSQKPPIYSTNWILAFTTLLHAKVRRTHNCIMK